MVRRARRRHRRARQAQAALALGLRAQTRCRASTRRPAREAAARRVRRALPPDPRPVPRVRLAALHPLECPRGTFESYRRNVLVHVVPQLGDVSLQQLGPARLIAFYADLLAGGQRRALSPRTVRYLHTIVRRSLQAGVRWGLVTRNVADQADPPSPKAARPRPMTRWRRRRARPLPLVGVRRSALSDLARAGIDRDAARRGALAATGRTSTSTPAAGRCATRSQRSATS